MDLINVILFYLFLPTLILAVVLFIIYKTSKGFKSYLGKNYSEIIVNILVVVWSVFVGAILALQLTKGLQEDEDEKNYLSMLNSCKNMNEHYLKNVKVIIDSLESNSNRLEDLNYLTKNIEDPFLFREILKNSDLYQHSSENFKNWLPEIISFLQETNWEIKLRNLADYYYRYNYLHFIKDMLYNEEKFILEDLSETKLNELSEKAREKLNNFAKTKSINQIIIGDSNDTVKINSEILDPRILKSIEGSKDSVRTPQE